MRRGIYDDGAAAVAEGERRRAWRPWLALQPAQSLPRSEVAARLHPQIPQKLNPNGIEVERNAIRIHTAKQAFMRVCGILQGRLSGDAGHHEPHRL